MVTEATPVFPIYCNIYKLNKKVETPAAPPAPTKEEVLLTEIRDLLTAQKASTTDNEKEADNIPALESDKKDS